MPHMMLLSSMAGQSMVLPPVVQALGQDHASSSQDSSKDIENRERDVSKHLVAIFQRFRLSQATANAQHRSYLAIPPFYSAVSSSSSMVRPPPSDPEEEALDTVRRKLRAMARSRFLQRREAQLVNAQDVAEVCRLLQESQSPPLDSSARPEDQEGGNTEDDSSLSSRCNYERYCLTRDEVPPRARCYFNCQGFFQCTRDVHGRISTDDFFRNMYSAILQDKAKITLHTYDVEGHGYLRESDLENYIFELIGGVPALRSMPENFYPFYVFTAVRRFMFFLDPKRTGKVAIRRMVGSPVMEDLLELASSPGIGAAEDEEPMSAESEEYVRLQRAKNWFSYDNALRIYSVYLELDEDHDGLLSRGELMNYAGPLGTIRLTGAFVNRIYEESITYHLAESSTDEPEMDYKVFLDFVLAMENRNTSQALQYFFRMFDFHHEGVLTPFCIKYFFREVVLRLQENGYDGINMEDVKDEIFDMVNPKEPGRITLQDLIHSGVGETIVSMLIDVKGFLNYDNRENVIAASVLAEQQPAENPPEGHE